MASSASQNAIRSTLAGTIPLNEQKGLMEKKTVLAVVLSLAVVLGWNFWYYHRYKDTLEANLKAAEQKAVEKETKPAEAAPAAALAQPAGTVDPMAAIPAEQSVNPRTVVVDTGVSLITLSNAGGVIQSLQLTKFTGNSGSIVDLVDPKSPLKPLALKFATPEATQKINKTLFATDAPESITLTAEKPDTTVVFHLSLDNGVIITKKLIFSHGSYIIGLEVDVAVPGGDVTGSTFGLAWTGLGGDKDSISYHGPVVLVDGKRLEDAPKPDELKDYAGKVLWSGLTDKYFCGVFLLDAEKSKVATAQPYDKGYEITVQLASNAGPNKLSLYAGPKDHAILNKAGHDLDRIINYGWFNIIASPLYMALLWINTFVGNYGWSVIILTILVKLIFWPMTQSSFRSMEKMRVVQPQLKKLQERYKNDKVKLNEEMIALYREHRINPLSGCLPIILQIPVFVALYKVLLESIELKGAPFMLWIHDLSVKDPYYVFPVLMGASMFVQQKMSPASTDPIQRNIMLILPVVFTVMFINFPAGLVIYWLVNNLLSILQQYIIRLQKKED